MKRDDLYRQIHDLESRSKHKPRKLESKDGVFLLDQNNPHDVEWFENDEEYQE